MRQPQIESVLQSIAANIRRLRLRRGLTQAQLAEAAEIETRYVQTLETGKANPSAAILVQVGHALGVDAGQLFRAATPVRRPTGHPRGRTRSS